ncbi:LysR family transcriptional regulator [Rhodanobacter sp. 115]|uniref:LysR family transcriptional regulator n=1 Tax=Rhodanobacter sp. FW021-MT20 TaxID=1162282 RepID=UPI0034E3A8B2
MPDVDLNLLMALDALLEEGSVTGAARRLGLSTSAMSRTLARLRAATGDPLLVRAGRGMVPTPRADELRGRVHELTRSAHAVLRPAAAGLDLATLQRSFTIRANDGFVEIFAAPLVAAVTAAAPNVRLRFAPKPDKNVQALREGMVDLEIGVLGASGPEVRVQGLFRDHFVGVVRAGHALLEQSGSGKNAITPERYAACGHVVASRRGLANGPVDVALAELGLARTVVAVVPGFRAALAVASTSDLVAQVTGSFFHAVRAGQTSSGAATVDSFPLPVRTEAITVSQMWHPRFDADPAHRWLRELVRATCREPAW